MPWSYRSLIESPRSWQRVALRHAAGRGRSPRRSRAHALVVVGLGDLVEPVRRPDRRRGVEQERVWRAAVPVLLAGGDPGDVPGPDRLGLALAGHDEARARDDLQDLADVVRVPVGPRTRAEEDVVHRHA